MNVRCRDGMKRRTEVYLSKSVCSFDVLAAAALSAPKLCAPAIPPFCLAAPMEQSPSKTTPSVMINRGLSISPYNRAGAVSCTFSLATTLPSTLPRIITTSPEILARTSARSPMVSVPWHWISPSTLPSTLADPWNVSWPVTRLPL